MAAGGAVGIDDKKNLGRNGKSKIWVNPQKPYSTSHRTAAPATRNPVSSAISAEAHSPFAGTKVSRIRIPIPSASR